MGIDIYCEVFIRESLEIYTSVLQSSDSVESNRHYKEQPPPTTATAKNGHCKERSLQRTSTAKNSHCKKQSLQRTLTGVGIVLLSILSCLVLLVIFVLLLCGSFPCFPPWQVLQQAVGQCLDKRLFRSRVDLIRISSRSRPDLV